MNADEQGRAIYKHRKDLFDRGARNTQGWRESVRGNHLQKIVEHCGGSLIPFSFFSESKEVCRSIFKSKNCSNYIYYTINMAVELGKLKETDEGLKCLR